jgi:hypothetical protein
MLKLQTLRDFKEALAAIDPSFDDALVSFNNIDFYNTIVRRGPDQEYEDFDKCILRMRLNFPPANPNTAQSEFVIGPMELFNQMERDIFDNLPEPTEEVAFDEPEDFDNPGVVQGTVAGNAQGQAVPPRDWVQQLFAAPREVPQPAQPVYYGRGIAQDINNAN